MAFYKGNFSDGPFATIIVEAQNFDDAMDIFSGHLPLALGEFTDEDAVEVQDPLRESGPIFTRKNFPMLWA